MRCTPCFVPDSLGHRQSWWWCLQRFAGHPLALIVSGPGSGWIQPLLQLSADGLPILARGRCERRRRRGRRGEVPELQVLCHGCLGYSGALGIPGTRLNIRRPLQRVRRCVPPFSSSCLYTLLLPPFTLDYGALLAFHLYIYRIRTLKNGSRAGQKGAGRRPHPFQSGLLARVQLLPIMKISLPLQTKS